MIDKQESIRLHEDWWGQCRTCRFWEAPEGKGLHGVLTRPNLGEFLCVSPLSKVSGQLTGSDGGCSKWDSFDTDTALEVL
jgi:hypothetical protein